MATTSTSTPEISIDPSPPLDPSTEVHVAVHSEGRATNKASQDGCRPTRVIPTPEVNDKYRRLFNATLKGDCKAVKKILNEDCEAMTAKVMTIGGKSTTVLDVAIMTAHDQLVESLVKWLPPEVDISIIMRALNDAARRGRVRMVKALVDKVDTRLERIPMALLSATTYAPMQKEVDKVEARLERIHRALLSATTFAPMQKEVIWYLARRTKSAPYYATMTHLINAGHLDIALYLARQYPDMATSDSTKNHSMLGDLAKMRSCFPSGARLNFWQDFIYKCIPLCLVDPSFDKPKGTKMARGTKAFIERFGESKWRHKCSVDFANLALIEMKTRMETPNTVEFLLTSGIILDAASRGICEIVRLCLQHFPELLWDKSFTKELIKEVVNGRHVELFRLVNEHNTIPHFTDSLWSNHVLMKAVTEWSPRCVSPNASGAAFLMQREIQWFKAVEDRSFPSFKSRKLMEKKEERGTTYWEVFVEQHQELLKEARQWVNKTSSSCSVVATLIITVTFATAFTIPGGNEGSAVIPIFLKKGPFMVFAVADALALFSSVTATLVFLTILTSSYTIEDFHHSLPRKLILGLTFLFLSLVFMLVAFGSALTIILREQLKWIYIPITLLAAIPIILFAILQIPLYFEMFESTFRSHLDRPLKLWK